MTEHTYASAWIMPTYNLPIVDLELIFLNALNAYFVPWGPPNCRWTLLYLLWIRDSEYPASEEDILKLLSNDYSKLSENEVPEIWDLAIWHRRDNFQTVLHAGLVIAGWKIKSRNSPNPWSQITEEWEDVISRSIRWECNFPIVPAYYRKR